MRHECRGAYEFGPFLLNPSAHRLFKNGEPVSLPPKAFDTLLVLVQHQGALVEKDALISAVWPDAFVEENNLTQYVSMLRRVLGEDGKYIETIPRLGYRFVAGVREIGAGEENAVWSRRTRTHMVVREEEEQDQGSEAPVVAATRTAPRVRARNAAVVIACTTVVLLVALMLYSRHQRTDSALARSTLPRTLAVLPLRNLKPAPETDFLSLALADAIINRLGYASELVVRPASSVAKYRNADTDPTQIAREQKVQAVLAGSYLKEGDQIRVTTELITIDDGGGPARDSIELNYDKLLSLQDRVAASVIHSLGLALQPEEVDRMKRGLPTNPLAYEYYLRSREPSIGSDFKRAVNLLEQSVALEPGNAMVWAGLATNYLGYARVQGGGQPYADKGWEAFQRALALDPENPLIVDLIAFHMIENNRIEEAVPLLRESLRHNPNDSWAHWYLSEAYRYGGALDQSVQEGTLARRLNPTVGDNMLQNTYLYLGQYQQFLASLPLDESNARTTFYRGLAYCYLNDTNRALSEFDRAFALDPSLLHSQIGQAFTHAFAARQLQGLELMGRVERSESEDGEMVYKMAQAYAQLGDKKSSLRLLQRSIELNFFPYSYFLHDPLLGPLRTEPEYSAMMEVARRRQEAFLQRFF